MHWPDGYALKSTLRATPRSEILIAVREADQSEVVLKRYPSDRGMHGRESRARLEFDALRALAGHGIPRAHELIAGEVPVVVLEYVPGVSLAAWRERARGPTSPADFLILASRLTEILERVHAAHFVHRDVTPYNVVIDGPELRPYLIDFGLARRLGAPSLAASSGLAQPVGTLSYISPEQTGRMNRDVDARSDLYSLGATLYLLLTGHPPFRCDDPLALLHAHLAVAPAPPVELEPGVPDVLSRLVVKLLKKEPEERYQTASALRADLLELHGQWERAGELESGFTLGKAEVPDRPLVPATIHGRERESARLRELLAQSAAGSVRIALIAGEAGSGKSALVDTLRPELVERRGYLAVGRFDPHRDRPYAGLAAALGSLVQQLLVEPDAHLARWRTALREALGSIAQALVDVVPDIRFILGDVSPVPALGPRETQARLSLALQRFIATCASPEHPLVLFLDDLQWSDAGSRALLEELITDSRASGLFVIGAYRSAEQDADHPLAHLLARLQRLEERPETLELGPLRRSAAAAMLAEILSRSEADVRGLAELVERKTGNLPLLVQRFVDHIHERGLLRYERAVGWVWDSAQVAACDIPDGAVGLVTSKLARLDPDGQALLGIASCVGREFDAALICELSRGERARVDRGLFALADAGLIAPCSGGFRFVHERIRESAALLRSHAESSRLHHEIACLLLERIPESERKERVFEIVEHLNRSTDHPRSSELRATALELNLLAGTRALASGVAATAESYLAVARSLLRREDWEARWAACFAILLSSSEAAFQTSQFELALELLDRLEEHKLTVLEFAQVAIKRLQVFALTQSPELSTRYALGVLRRLGVRWPLHPSRARAWLGARSVQWRLRGRLGPALFRPAATIDPGWRAQLMVLNASAGVMSRFDARLRLLASCLTLRRYLSRGYAGAPGFALAAFVSYAYWILGQGADPERAVRCALGWNERVSDPVSGPRAEMLVHALVRPWLMRRREAVEPLDRVAERCREAGDREYEYYSRFLAATYRLLVGQEVSECEETLRELALAVERSGLWYPAPQAVHRAYRPLLDDPSDADLERALAESDAWLETDTSSSDVYVRTCWMLVLCVRGRHDLAFAQSETLGERIFRVVPFVHMADHTFYRGLAASALAADARGRERLRYRRALSRSVRRLRRWARSGPDFVHMRWLLEAEQLRLRGRFAGARDRYQRGAQRAKEHGFSHHAALAHERLGRMLCAQRRDTDAAGAFAEAIAFYQHWGAHAKGKNLAEERRRLTFG